MPYANGRRAANMCLVVLSILSLTTGQSMGRAAGLQSAPHARASSFHGNCYSYRAALWKFTQATADDQTLWWTVLQADYHGDYPPRPGGSVPDVAEQQANAEAMRGLEYSLIGNKGNDPNAFDGGIGNQAANVADQYGADSSQATPYGWAINELLITISNLAEAAIDEARQYGSGLGSFHDSQQYLTYTWQALKQLACKPAAPKPPKSPVSQPSRLSEGLLRLSDLAPGYRVQFQHPVWYDNMSDYWGNFETPARMRIYGWQGSYDIGFIRSNPFRTISEEISLFSSEYGADLFYLDRASLDRQSSGIQMGTQLVGKTAYHYFMSGQFGTSASIVFQRGRYIVDLTIEPSSSYGALVQIAKYIDHRIESNGGAP